MKTSMLPEKENETTNKEGGDKKKFFVFNLAIEDKVAVAITLSILSFVFSILFNLFVEPDWVLKLQSSNKQISDKIHNKSLILIGSGTVYQHLSHNALKDYYKTIDSSCVISVGIPSLVAMKTLKNEESSVKNHGWIVMSAIEAKESDFMEEYEAEKFKKNRKIVEVFIRKDKLKVIPLSNSSFFHSYFGEKDYIAAIDLKKLISEVPRSEYNLYTTSLGSGTRAEFEKIVGNIPEKMSKVFDLNSVETDTKPSLILCSDGYQPKGFKNERQFTVRDSADRDIEKELFLYFNGEYDKDKNEVSIPGEIKVFLSFVKKDFVPAVGHKMSDLIIRDRK